MNATRIFLQPYGRFRNDWNSESLNKRQDCPEAFTCIRVAGHRLLKPDLVETSVEHVKDFVMLFCSTQGCMNFYQVEASTVPGATFTCRDCNKATRRPRIGIQPHQFDQTFRGRAPEGVKTPGAWNTKRELREFLDGSDPMLNDGHQVKKDRRIERECPEWICDRFEFLNFLCEKFPGWLDETSPKHRQHREQAAMYAGVMYYYFRMGLPDTYVESLLSVPKFRTLEDGSEEFLGDRKVSKAKVKRIIDAIRKRRAGLRVDGTKLTGKRGRPRLTHLTKMVEILETEGVI